MPFSSACPSLILKRVKVVGHELSADSSHTKFVLNAVASIDYPDPDSASPSLPGIRVWTVLVRYKQFIKLHTDLVAAGKVQAVTHDATTFLNT